MINEKERECLIQLTDHAIWASSAWLREGLTDILRGLQNKGLVTCRNCYGVDADPLDIDDGAFWCLTDAGREALKA